jgi:hypothetical protein
MTELEAIARIRDEQDEKWRKGLDSDYARVDTDGMTTNDRGQTNCPKGLDPDYQHKVCRNCGRTIMLRRMTGGPNGSRAHWRHVGDGLAQYRSWQR